ncbi:hypothetical protein EUX98_g8866 [Antrodiella citrinella]|uniref:Protein kinase domain-containing protein n=1 Tax=Antrodiella citrinella TaxID=2447956 RepID=A0A4S4M7Z2_9APHY|nr:hypothetical protein EUX98_g8866 [Antrodiella citrinella]
MDMASNAAGLGLNILYDVLKELGLLAMKMQENHRGCAQLSAHGATVLRQIVAQYNARRLPDDTMHHIHSLTEAIQDINRDLASLQKDTRVKRFFWAHEIARKIRAAYARLDNAIAVFSLNITIDVRRQQEESETAAHQDYQRLEKMMKQILHNEATILSFLQVKQVEMQETIVSMNKRIRQLSKENESKSEKKVVERTFLEKGITALRQHSGPLRDVEKEGIISQLDVVIHRGEKDKIGSGGFGTVYKGTYHGRLVAVKELHKGIKNDIVMREMRIWKDLDHPHILKFYGGSPSSNPPFLICEYKHNGNALVYLKKYPRANRRQLLLDASKGLAYLHLMKANILVDRKGEACLSDFGLSEIKQSTTKMTQATKTGLQATRCYGTLAWTAPDQYKTGPNFKTDVYSFAITMWEVYTLGTPFEHLMVLSASDFLNVVAGGERPEQPTYFKTHDVDLWELIERAWNRDSNVRPTAQKLSEAIERKYSAHQYPSYPKPLLSVANMLITPRPMTPTRRASTSDIRYAITQNPVVRPAPRSAPPSSYPNRPPAASYMIPASVPLPIPTTYGAPARNVDGVYTANPQDYHNYEESILGFPMSSSPTSYHTPRVTRHKSIASLRNLKPTNIFELPTTRSRYVWRNIESYLYELIKSWSLGTLHDASFSSVSLGMVNDVALSIWVLQMFKRYVKGEEEKGKPVTCHAIFPIHVAMVDGSIRDGTYDGGVMALREFWEITGQDGTPDVLLAIGRHWADESRWVVHKWALRSISRFGSTLRLLAFRFSLSSATVSTYALFTSHTAPEIKHMHPGWWHIIRKVWPDSSSAQPAPHVELIYRPRQLQSESSLATAMLWRHLLQGSDTDLQVDLNAARTIVKEEIDRLINMKEARLL